MMKRKLMISLLAGLLILSIFPAAHSQTGWLSGWSYRRSHIFLQETSAAANFQYFVTVHYGAGSSTGGDIYLNGHCQADFDDIRITDDTGANLWNITRKNYSYGDQADIWVLLEDDLSSQNVQVWIYYGNVDAASVWDDDGVFVDVISDVVLALPMDEGTGSTTYDYSGFDNDGDLNTEVGWESSGFRYNATGYEYSQASRIYVDDADSLSFPDSGFTWCLWLYLNKTYWGAGQEWATMWAKSDFIYEYWYSIISSREPHSRLADMDFSDYSNGETAYNDVWWFMTLRWNGTSGGYVDWFLNATAGDSDAWSTGFSGSTQTEDLVLGAVVGGGYGFSGRMDEIMMINGTLTDVQISLLADDTYYSDLKSEEGECLIRLWADPYPSHGLTSGEEIIQTQGSSLLAALVVGIIILIPVFAGVLILLRRR